MKSTACWMHCTVPNVNPATQRLRDSGGNHETRLMVQDFAVHFISHVKSELRWTQRWRIGRLMNAQR